MRLRPDQMWFEHHDDGASTMFVEVGGKVLRCRGTIRHTESTLIDELESFDALRATGVTFDVDPDSDSGASQVATIARRGGAAVAVCQGDTAAVVRATIERAEALLARTRRN